MKRYRTESYVEWLDVESHLWCLIGVVFLNLWAAIYLHQNTLLLLGSHFGF